MARESMASFLSVNQGVVNPTAEQRQFRLPVGDSGAQLNQEPVRAIGGARRMAGAGAIIIGSAKGALPEIASDLIDEASNYAVGNVRRERSQSAEARLGLGQWMGRVLGSHRVARP